jgi:hypothetical protein
VSGRAEEFGHRLVDLVGNFSDVPNGNRGYQLFVAFGAMLTAEKGAPPTMQQFAEMCALCAKKMLAAGLVLP